MKRLSNGQLYYASLCAYLPALSFGIMVGYTSPALPEMEKMDILTKDQASWFGSLATLGAMLGSFLGGGSVQWCGRRLTLILTAIPFCLGWGLIWWNGGSADLYMGRFLTGVASGMTVVTSPLYIAEICTKDLRGMLGSGVQLAITIGILFVYCLGMFFHWHTIAVIAAAIPLVAVLLTLRIPDSPRYYVLKNNRTLAGHSLALLRSASHSEIEEELREIENSLDSSSSVTFRDFMEPQLLRPMVVAVGVMVLQQASGINAVMFYTVSIFESAGYSDNSTLATVVIGAVQVVFTYVACILMDRAGRRVLLLLAGTGMTLTCLSMAYYYHMLSQGTSLSWLAMFNLVVYIISFSIGWGPIPMLVMSEIFPVKARGPASGVTTFITCLAAFIVTKEFASLQATYGSDGTFLIFGVFCALGLVFVYIFLPETKGKSLEDIELYFTNRSNKPV